LRTLTILVACALFVACSPSGELDVHRARLAAERRNLEATFDALEDRLMVNQSRVRFWREMRDRHESVTAVACASLDRHAEDVARIVNRNRERHASLHPSSVAGRTPDRGSRSGRGGTAD
jgi:hypothetical protein